LSWLESSITLVSDASVSTVVIYERNMFIILAKPTLLSSLIRTAENTYDKIVAWFLELVPVKFGVVDRHLFKKEERLSREH